MKTGFLVFSRKPYAYPSHSSTMPNGHSIRGREKETQKPEFAIRKKEVFLALAALMYVITRLFPVIQRIYKEMSYEPGLAGSWGYQILE